jgi:hypothetical protein
MSTQIKKKPASKSAILTEGFPSSFQANSMIVPKNSL